MLPAAIRRPDDAKNEYWNIKSLLSWEERVFEKEICVLIDFVGHRARDAYAPPAIKRASRFILAYPERPQRRGPCLHVGEKLWKGIHRDYSGQRGIIGSPLHCDISEACRKTRSTTTSRSFICSSGRMLALALSNSASKDRTEQSNQGRHRPRAPGMYAGSIAWRTSTRTWSMRSRPCS